MSGFPTSAIQHIGIAIVATGACLAPLTSAQTEQEKSAGQIIVLPNLMVTNNALSMHLPGNEYSAGSGWWALACPAQCQLYSLSLTIKPKQHPVYDGDPVPGQVLSFTPLPPVNDVLAVFNPSPLGAQLQLRAGSIPTYYPGTMPHLRRPHSPGTMEAEIGLPDGRVAHLIPIALLPPDDTAKSSQHDNANSPPTLQLELQMEGRRQIVGTFSFGIEGPLALRPRDYVIWAGDLDSDNKLDLLLNFDFAGSNRTLFLSSLARDGEIVGEAGRFQYFPIDAAGC